jgi:hypothetical protein
LTQDYSAHHEIDDERYKDAHDTGVAFGDAVTMSWDDLVLDVTCLDELSGTEETLIEERLGYVPAQATIVPHLAFIRATMQQYQQGQISAWDYEAALDRHIEDIRDADMREGGWLIDREYGQEWYEAYETKLVEYKKYVRDRLTRFLGYAPNLEHSLAAEMFMRERVAKPYWIDSDEPTWLDYRMMTVIICRKKEEGK